MKKKKTLTDSWSCVPQLKEACNKIDELGHFVYEIKHCVRVSNLEEMVYDMKLQLQEAIDCLDEIDTDVEWVTEDDDPIWNGPSEDLLPDDE